VPVADRRAPLLRLGAVRPPTTALLRRRGLALPLRTDEPATVRVVLRAGARVLARRTVRLDGYAGRTVRLRARLRRAPRAALRLTVTATDAAGNPSTVRRPVRVRRG
jgi:hypothetical protein